MTLASDELEKLNQENRDLTSQVRTMAHTIMELQIESTNAMTALQSLRNISFKMRGAFELVIQSPHSEMCAYWQTKKYNCDCHVGIALKCMNDFDVEMASV